MQKMTTTQLMGFRNEYEMTCAAQDGDGRAWMTLWNRYQALLMSRLRAVRGLTKEELESEALDVFATKLSKFKRWKVSSDDAYSMFSWLYCSVINRTDQLIRQREKDVHMYFEKVNAAGMNFDVSAADDNLSSDNALYSQQRQMIGVNDEIYNTYNPEKLVVEKLCSDDTERVKAFYSKLTQFQKDILEARREGLTFAEIANRFSCSATTVKNHLARAKKYAEKVFEVSYA